MAQYLRIIRKSKHNTRIELPDHSTILIPTESLPMWELVKVFELSKEGVEIQKKEKPVKVKKEPKPKSTSNKGTWSFRKNTNGLGVSHPYETVDMLYTPVIYAGDIEAPF